MWQIKAFPKRYAQNDVQTLIEITSRWPFLIGCFEGFRESRHLNEKFGLDILHTRSVYVREYVTKVTVRVFKVDKGGPVPVKSYDLP